MGLEPIYTVTKNADGVYVLSYGFQAVAILRPGATLLAIERLKRVAEKLNSIEQFAAACDIVTTGMDMALSSLPERSRAAFQGIIDSLREAGKELRK